MKKLLFIYCLFLIGCLAPSKMTREEKAISISIFKNTTKEYELSYLLNLAMIDEIMKNPNFKIKKDAELNLKGCIIEHKKTPIAWTKDREITEYSLSITVEFEVFDKNALVLKNRITDKIIYSKNDNEKQEEQRLLKRISRKIVKKIVNVQVSAAKDK